MRSHVVRPVWENLRIDVAGIESLTGAVLCAVLIQPFAVTTNGLKILTLAAPYMRREECKQ